MRGILEFNLPEDQAEYQYAIDGMDWAIVVRQTCEYLRSQLKHGHAYETFDEALEDIRDFITKETQNRNLDIYQ
tara:strand:+ start:336 stop:557 length:222 start_codon:yes stop_codon:yes gene_type:complete